MEDNYMSYPVVPLKDFMLHATPAGYELISVTLEDGSVLKNALPDKLSLWIGTGERSIWQYPPRRHIVLVRTSGTLYEEVRW